MQILCSQTWELTSWKGVRFSFFSKADLPKFYHDVERALSELRLHSSRSSSEVPSLEGQAFPRRNRLKAFLDVLSHAAWIDRLWTGNYGVRS